MNPRPSGYEPDELPGCSTPRWFSNYKRAAREVFGMVRGNKEILYRFADPPDSVRP